MSAGPTVLWFRQDLRLDDNPALAAAVRRGGPVIPLFVWDEEGEGKWAPGGAGRWWLHHSLRALDSSLREAGLRLVILAGRAEQVIPRLLEKTGASAVYWNRRYEPAVRERDARIKADLVSAGYEAKSFNAALLYEPHTVANREGKPFQVFSPYWRHCLERTPEPPTKRPRPPWQAPAKWPSSLEASELKLLPKLGWAGGFAPVWRPGEAGAQARLRDFAARPVERYDRSRDRPDEDGTSRLSAHLHWGEIGPRQVWGAIARKSKASGVFPAGNGERVFLAELGWREFAHHLLYHFPATPERPLRPAFERFPWAEDPGGVRLKAWQQGMTGYPIVDAGMRQLWRTGWMHNRVRMVVASFLVKHLLLPWQEGAAWFWDTLLDADLANNSLGWQWSAGCGADASPFFRIFAPVLQGRKFDPQGTYVRRWIPELEHASAEWIHAPWEGPPAERGRYPAPIVDHATARAEALAAYEVTRRSLRA